ncbi:3'-5' exoribonuclease YhaM family protein [Archangium lansingense]|uniref:HD domain-containing protein n=1 Tax=Archangium lansingense TaxID=2995310 RepID=A0ABT4A5A2_9BACT|nr:HD domain-containing protein [Archangium lansinium]MCY1076816.1 HD domain-containing protein [Archangium lansinium]
MTTDNPSDNSPTSSPTDASVETVRKVYAKDLREKDSVNTVFRVTKKERVTARSGKVFLSVVLVDKSGEIDARVFDKVEPLESTFSTGDFVLVRGNVIAFHGKSQVVIEALEKLDPEPLDPKEFEPPAAPPAREEQPAPKAAAPAPTPAREAREERREEQAAPKPGGEGHGGARAVGQIRELITERVNDPNVKALLLAFLDDAQIAAGLPHAPAAKGVHHAYRGGLADHLLSVMRLTLRVADHYPMADRDLLLAGAFLHDVMKVAEISADKGFEYTDEGKLVGHLVMTAQKIREKTLAIPNFPPLLEQHLTHLVLAHHGRLEYGSPKLPMTIEAHIVHALDSLDSRIASWVEAMQRDPNERWTENLKLYDRQLWKGPVPTSRGRAPVEGGRRKGKDKKPKEQRPERAAGAPAGEGQQAPRSEKPERQEKQREPRPPREPREPRERREPREGQEPREAREPREPKPPRERVDVPKELTFKPFSVLTSAKTEPAGKPGGEGSDTEG